MEVICLSESQNRAYKVLNAYIGSLKIVDVLVFYEDGYSVYVASDDYGLMFYREQNFYHEPFSFNFAHLRNIVGKARHVELIPTNEGLVVKTGKSQTILQTKPAQNTLSWPELPNNTTTLNLTNIINAYDKISFFNSVTTGNCSVILCKSLLNLRNHSSEIRVETDVGVDECVTIDFKAFAHFVKVIKSVNLDYISARIDKDIQLFSDNVYFVLQCAKNPIILDFTNMYYCGTIYTGGVQNGTSKTIKLNELLSAADICLQQAISSHTTASNIGLPVNKEIPVSKLNILSKKISDIFELYTIHDFVMLKHENVSILFF